MAEIKTTETELSEVLLEVVAQRLKAKDYSIIGVTLVRKENGAWEFMRANEVIADSGMSLDEIRSRLLR